MVFLFFYFHLLILWNPNFDGFVIFWFETLSNFKPGFVIFFSGQYYFYKVFNVTLERASISIHKSHRLIMYVCHVSYQLNDVRDQFHFCFIVSPFRFEFKKGLGFFLTKLLFLQLSEEYCVKVGRYLGRLKMFSIYDYY